MQEPTDNPRPEDMVELLEELTLSTSAARPGQSKPVSNEPSSRGIRQGLEVQLKGLVRPADASRRLQALQPAGGGLVFHLHHITPISLRGHLEDPLGVGDHFRLDFGRELNFPSPDAATVRCVSCAEASDHSFEVELKLLIQPLDLRTALAPAAEA